MKFIFSVRSYMYDNSYHRFTDVFNIEANKIDIYNINMMNSNEQNRMLELLDTYSLWGKKAAFCAKAQFNDAIRPPASEGNRRSTFQGNIHGGTQYST